MRDVLESRAGQLEGGWCLFLLGEELLLGFLEKLRERGGGRESFLEIFLRDGLARD